jgi:hypothetical protein
MENVIQTIVIKMDITASVLRKHVEMIFFVIINHVILILAVFQDYV